MRSAAATIASPAEEEAPPAIDGAYRAASASGPPSDATATPVKPHWPIG